MSNREKFRSKEKAYYCVECERDMIRHRPRGSHDDEAIRRRCKVCRRESIFVPLNDWHEGAMHHGR